MQTTIIGEIGINHCGDVDQAINLARAAKEAGCTFVKLQKRDIKACYSPEELDRACESPWGMTVRDKVCGRELSWEEIGAFSSACDELGIRWFASCFDTGSLEALNARFPGIPYNKIPSALALDLKFCKAVAAIGKPTLISTGLCKFRQAREVAGIFEAADCKYVLNHCTALYPAPNDRLDLTLIPAMINSFRHQQNCLGVGYSGHELGLATSVVAVALGARWIERHITLDRSMYGADQAASIEPQGLTRLVRDIRVVEAALGQPVKRLLGDEKVPVSFWKREEDR